MRSSPFAAGTLLVLALSAAGCASGSRSAATEVPPPAVTPMAGVSATPGTVTAAQQALIGRCFDLAVGAWLPELPVGGDTLYMAPPPRIQLTGTPGPARMEGRMVVTAAPGAMPAAHRFSGWRVLSGDSVLITWSNGFSGIVVRLGPAPAGMAGWARTFWDFDREEQRAPVIATAMACDAPLPPHAQAEYRYLRGVALQRGDSIRIGEPLPDGLDAPLHPGSRYTYAVNDAVAGHFAGATQLLATIDDAGVVWQIRTQLAPGADFETLLATLVRMQGPPTSLHSAPGAAAPPHDASWVARMIFMSLSTNIDTGGVQVFMYDPRR